MTRVSLRTIKKLAALVVHPRYRRALRHGVAAAIEHTGVLSSVRCQTVVDIGANVGQFTLVTRVCQPDASVFAFEPLAGPAGVFRKVFGDDPKVRLFPVAIGPKAGRVTMHVSARVDSSSILPITDAQTQMFPGTGQRSTEQVMIEPLGALVARDAIKAPALLKLDVQGFELEALRGCADLLDLFDYLYVECSFVELYERQALAEDVILYLREQGFSLHGIHNVTRDSGVRCVQADFFFARKGVQTSA